MSDTAADGALRLVVEAINGADTETSGLDVTLLVDGAVVSGMIIPAWKWFTAISKFIHSDKGAPEADDTPRLFDEMATEFKELSELQKSSLDVPEDQWSEAQRRAQQPASFVHLRSATVVAGGASEASHEGTLMRLALASVSGWTLGHASDSLKRAGVAAWTMRKTDARRLL